MNDKAFDRVTIQDSQLTKRQLAKLKEQAVALGYGRHKFGTYIMRLLALAVEAGLDKQVEKLS